MCFYDFCCWHDVSLKSYILFPHSLYQDTLKHYVYFFSFECFNIILRFIFVKNSLKTEVTTALKRKSNIARFTITGFLFIIINSLGYFKRAIFLMKGKVCYIPRTIFSFSSQGIKWIQDLVWVFLYYCISIKIFSEAITTLDLSCLSWPFFQIHC